MKITTFSLRFERKEHVLKVNKSEITGENTFKGDLCETEANHDSSKDEETLFLLFLLICDECFNPKILKYVYLRIVSFL